MDKEDRKFEIEKLRVQLKHSAFSTFFNVVSASLISFLVALLNMTLVLRTVVPETALYTFAIMGLIVAILIGGLLVVYAYYDIKGIDDTIQELEKEFP